ncbi:hypothetical protein EMCRGX_G030632 [Ephydatia muelleri]|eukprot:Em0010g876a
MVERRKSEEVINFAPGPAKLPLEVLVEAAEQGAFSYKDSGISVMEMSHRSTDYLAMSQETVSLLRELLDIPANYHVLFLQGGGTGQFAAVPLNLSRSSDQVADYFVTGLWSKKAAEEAQKYLKVNKVLTHSGQYNSIQEKDHWKLTPGAAYVYYCANETVHGVEFPWVPETGDVPLVCDASSSFLTHKMDISKYALIFAGAQKNVGCAGVTIVVVRDDMIGKAQSICPSVWDYKIQADNSSTYNTPSVWGLYIVNLVLKWLKKEGGVEAIEERCATKAQMVYDTIHNSNGFYHLVVEPAFRSRVNIPFHVYRNGKPVKELEEKFVKEAEARNMYELKGHRSVGGLRASLYNAVSVEEVKTLVEFMKDFMARNRTE